MNKKERQRLKAETEALRTEFADIRGRLDAVRATYAELELIASMFKQPSLTR